MNYIEEEKKKKDILIKRFGEHLRYIRKKKNISAAELSRRTFIEKPNITRIEKGGINPSLYILKKIADALEISLEELFKGFE